MIRKLTEKDRSSVLEYLYQDPDFNIFLIGDIEAFGFNRDFQKVFGEFDDQGKYLGVYIKYRNNALYYSHLTRFNEAFLDIMLSDPFDFMSGKSDLMALIYPHLKGFRHRTMFFCSADTMENEDPINEDSIRVVSTREECGKLYDLLANIEEFGTRKIERDIYIEDRMIGLGMGVILYIDHQDTIISTAATTAETTKNAMVVAVATKEEYRKQGYGSTLVKALMELYINQKKKSLCLFYDNEEAGRIYKRLGFKDIGLWDMCDRITG